MGCKPARAELWAPHLTAAMDAYDINSVARQAAFLAQIGHESARLRYVREIWNPVQCPWQSRYEGRADLGNTEPGDGERFMGRGLIQITGRANYDACGKALGLDLNGTPELLETPKYASLSAGWFWDWKRLNALADVGDFERITRRINGGLNGQDDRLALYSAAQAAFA